MPQPEHELAAGVSGERRSRRRARGSAAADAADAERGDADDEILFYGAEDADAEAEATVDAAGEVKGGVCEGGDTAEDVAEVDGGGRKRGGLVGGRR